jgi:hypothetical protein
MSLLSIFNKAPKGDSYRIVESPLKYVGFILSEMLRKGTTGNNAAGRTKSNPSSIASNDNSKGTLPK